MSTQYGPNVYGMVEKTRKQDHVLLTNDTTRTILDGELCVHVDSDGFAFIGYCAESNGIAAGATGRIDLKQGKEVQTGQIAAVDLPAAIGNGIFVVKQTDTDPAEIKNASAAGRFPLPAQVTEFSSDPLYIQMRMPNQNGDIVAAV